MGGRRTTWGGAALAVALVLAVAGTATAASPGALERQLGAGVSVSGGAETGGDITFIGTEPGAAIPLDGSTPRAAALEAADRFAPSFGLRGDAELRVTGVDRVGGGRSSVELQQTVDGVPVIGGELIVNLDTAGDLLSVGGELEAEQDVDTTPAIAEDDAAETALLATARKHSVGIANLHVGAGELSVYDSRILGGPGLARPQLVWRFEVTGGDPVAIRQLVLIDAQLGVVALSFSEIHEAMSRRVCDANSANAKVPCTAGLAARTEGGPGTGVADVDNAYVLTGQVYDFFSTKFDRDSIDGEGMDLVSTVRFCQSACPYLNAFWNGDQMVYGTGLLTEDITGHELSHGVVEFESHLFYYYQSGAINESLADVFGELFDLSTGANLPANRWKIGEGSSIGVIRNMANPPELGDPDRMGSGDWYFDPETKLGGGGDNGGVHHNSGVNNKAAFLLTDGGSFNGRTVTGLGIDKALQLYYEVNANLLPSAGDYQDLGNALRQACANLIGEHGVTAADCTQVEQAVLATEMDSPPAEPEAAPREAATCAPGQTLQTAFFDDLENPASGNWATVVLQAANTFYYPQNSHPFANFDATYATSGTTNIWAYDRQGASDSAIAMTTDVTVPADGQLHFRHAFGFDTEGGTAFDGGLIEFSDDGGATWLDAGGLIDGGFEYLREIAPGFGNPLGGRLAFTGESGGYGSTRIDLSGWSGEQVRFRFRVGTDVAIDDYGWFIDDVRIYRCESEPEPPVTQPETPPSNPSLAVMPPPEALPSAPQPSATPKPSATKPKPKKCRPKQRKVKKKGKIKCVPKKGKRKARS